MIHSERRDAPGSGSCEDRFAVIILNYFGAADTIRCVQSVKQHMDAVCFIVDNSADQEEAIRLKKIQDYAPSTDFSWPVENLGFAAGVNLALRKALDRGFYRFFLLNNDAVICAETGDRIGLALSQNPGSIIAPMIRWADGICGKSFYHPYWGLISRRKPHFFSDWIPFLTGCALAFDQQLLELVGFFDSSFFLYGEDIFFCHKAQQKFASVILLENILVNHKGSHTAKMASFFYEHHIARMHWLLSFKVFENPVRQMVSLGTKAAYLVPRAVIRSLRYRTTAPLLALFSSPFNFRVRPK